MSNIDGTILGKAREWVTWRDSNLGVKEPHPYAGAGAEVIRSLPDEWVDAAKVRKYIADWREGLAAAPRSHYEEEMLDDLEALLLPPAPRTLADMTEEEREACQWMWADAATTDGETFRVLIINAGDSGDAYAVKPDGTVLFAAPGRITPLPELPRLEWPGDGDQVYDDGRPFDRPLPFAATYPPLDTAHIYRDRDGDTWYFLAGSWYCVDRLGSHGDVGFTMPPSKHGPYTRIEEGS